MIRHSKAISFFLIRSLLLPFVALPFILNAQTPYKTYSNDPIAVKEFTLSNGLTVMLSENHDSPKVFGAVVVKTGGKKDPADNTGMAHYLEHMLFKGTDVMGTFNYEKEKILLDKINQLYDELGKTKDPEKRKTIQKEINRISVEAAEYAIPNEMDRMISEIGGEDVNAFTTDEMTVYFNSFPGNQIQKWLDIYSSRFINPVFRLFQSELETVYEEKNISMDNPFAYVFEKYLENFYKVHPYGQQTVIGKTEHLKNPSLTAMYNYYNTWYVANNMALIISGDIYADEIIPIIENKFGKWKSGVLPEFPNYQEKSFKGRESIKIRATPVAVGACGFRVPPINDRENEIMSVITIMLSNEESAGLLDELNNEGKLMSTFSYANIQQDYGALMLAFIPKPFKQSLKKAEKLIDRQLNKLRSGDFDESLLISSKTSLLKSIERNWEENEYRCLQMCESFSRSLKWGDYIDKIYNINSITKEDVIAFSNKYLNENRLVMYSKMGFGKKDKLEKPGFEPVIPKNEEHSAYYKEWINIPESPSKPKFIDLEKDVESTTLQQGVSIHRVYNPFNEIATLNIIFGCGSYYIPFLQYAPDYITIANSLNHNAIDFNDELFSLGCSINYYSEEDEFIISIEGLEKNIPDALKLLNDHIHFLKKSEKKITEIWHNLNTELKISKRDPGFMSYALNEFAIYGSNSEFLRQVSLQEFKDDKGNRLVQSIAEILNYEARVTYVGKSHLQEISEMVQNNFSFSSSPTPKRKRVFIPANEFNETKIYIYEYKKALQSQINFYIDGANFSLNDVATITAFNNYFAGDMSSLVFQEIREFRSLAYSTYAWYSVPHSENLPCHFSAYIGCQADKTNDAIDAMLELIHHMPLKSDRWKSLQSNLIQKTYSDRPGFRKLNAVVNRWKELGYQEDPSIALIEKYKNMTFSDLEEFWKKEIKNKPIVISIVGNTAAYDMERLKKIGKIEFVKENQILKK